MGYRQEQYTSPTLHHEMYRARQLNNMDRSSARDPASPLPLLRRSYSTAYTNFRGDHSVFTAYAYTDGGQSVRILQVPLIEVRLIQVRVIEVSLFLKF